MPRRKYPDEDVLGRGRYAYLQPDVEGPTRWGHDAEWFSDELFRACGARIAWHRTRNVYVVYKRRQHGNRPLVPIRDITRDLAPLNSMLVRSISFYVKLIEAQLRKDIDREMNLWRQRIQDSRDEEYRHHMDSIMPELRDMQEKYMRVLGDGRYRQRIFDLAS